MQATLNKILQKEILDTQKKLKLPKDVLSFILSGKRIRAKIISTSFSKNEQSISSKLASLIELTHASSLIHDDIIDESQLRRGKPTAFNMLTVPNASSIGYFLFSRLFLSIIRFSPCIYEHYFQILSEMCEGQILEIETTKSNKVSISKYLKTIKLKTGSLFAFCFGVQNEGWNKHKASLGYRFGLAFQILDDIYDVTQEELIAGKPRGQDEKQGIVTLPFLYGDINQSKNKALSFINQIKLAHLPHEWQKIFSELSEKIKQVSCSTFPGCMDNNKSYQSLNQTEE